MNYNQQIQEPYKCNGCLRLMSFGKVKRHCLDDKRSIRMECVLCSECSRIQYSSKETTGLFSLLTGIEKPTAGFIRVIKTPEFERHEKEEMKAQQEQLRISQLPQFDCDKCRKPITRGEEKEHQLILYENNPALVGIVLKVKCRILCPFCYGKSSNLFVPGTDFSNAEREETPTFIRFQEYKQRLRDQSNPLAKWERQVEGENQAKMKKE